VTKEELLATLRGLAKMSDIRRTHEEADAALLKYINDPAVTRAFKRIDKWYA